MLNSVITLQASHPNPHFTNLDNKPTPQQFHASSVHGKAIPKSSVGLVLRTPDSDAVSGSSSRTMMNYMVSTADSKCQQEEKEDDVRIGVQINYDQKVPPWGDIKESREGYKTEALMLKKLNCKLKPKLHFLEENDEEVLSKRMLALSRSNKIKSALSLYMSMEAWGLRPNAHACNSLISSLLRNDFFDDCLKVFDMMMKSNKDKVTGHTCSLILKAVGTRQGFDSALEMFVALEDQDILRNDHFDVIAYNTMISICGKANNWFEAERMWKLMKQSGHKGTSVTYSLLVSIFVRCDQSELAFEAYSEMVRNGLEPCEDVMKAIILAFTKEEKSDLALGVFHSMLNNGFNPDTFTYNGLINSLGKAGEAKLAFQVFSLMRYSGHTPDEYTYNALLCALNRANRYGDALSLFESVKREKGSQLNPHIYNTALISCQRLGLWDRALQILWQMEASGMSISTASFNLVLGACETARKPKVALQIYEQMVHRKCTPDTFTYLSLIRSCIWGSLWSEVKEILEHVSPSASLYNAVIHGMCLQGKIESAKKLYMKMREIGLQPDGKTRSLMIQNLKRDSVRHRYLSRLQL